MFFLKGQIAVENLAVLAVFLALLIPFVLFVLSNSSVYLSTSSQEATLSSLYIIKSNLEEAYAQCPYSRTFLLMFGNVDGLKIINHNMDGKDPKIEILASTSRGEVSIPVAIKNHNPGIVRVWFGDQRKPNPVGFEVEGLTGTIRMNVSCVSVYDSTIGRLNYYLEVDKVG